MSYRRNRWRKKRKKKRKRGKDFDPKRAYEIRVLTRQKWNDIAVIVGYSDGAAAWHGARRYAARNNLPWPIPWMSIGEYCYTELENGTTLDTLDSMMQPKQERQSRARRLAREYARRTGSPWPPRLRRAL